MKKTDNILGKYVLPLTIAGTMGVSSPAFPQNSNDTKVPTVVGLNGYKVAKADGLLTKMNANGKRNPFIPMTSDTLEMINNYIKIQNPKDGYNLSIIPIVAEGYKVENNKVIAGKDADEGLFAYVLTNNTEAAQDHPNWLKKTYFPKSDCIDDNLNIANGKTLESGLFILDKDGKVDTGMQDKLKGLISQYKSANDSLNAELARAKINESTYQDLINNIQQDNYCCDSTLATLQKGFKDLTSSLNAIKAELGKEPAPKGHFYLGVIGSNIPDIGGVLGYEGNKPITGFVEVEGAKGKVKETRQETQYNGFGSEDKVNTDYVIEQTRAMLNAGIKIPLIRKGNFSLNFKPSVGAGYVAGNSIGTTTGAQLEGFDGFEIPNNSEVLTEKYGKLVTQGKLGLSAKIKNFEVEAAYGRMFDSPYNSNKMNEGSNHLIKQSQFLKDNSYLQLKLGMHFGNK